MPKLAEKILMNIILLKQGYHNPGHLGLSKVHGGSRPRKSWFEKVAEGKVVSEEIIKGGVNKALQLTFDNGAIGLYKKKDSTWHKHPEYEVAVYEFSAATGIDNVPETMLYTHEGSRGSMHRYVEDVFPGSMYNYNNQIKTKLKDEKDDVLLIDYLFQNSDRHPNNYLVSVDGKAIWAIDHDLVQIKSLPTDIKRHYFDSNSLLSYDEWTRHGSTGDTYYYQLDDMAFDAVKKMKREQLESILSSTLPPKERANVWTKIKALQNNDGRIYTNDYMITLRFASRERERKFQAEKASKRIMEGILI